MGADRGSAEGGVHAWMIAQGFEGCGDQFGFV